MSDEKITSVLQTQAVDPNARQDPHSILKVIRETTPVMDDEVCKVTLLTKFKDVQSIVNDRSMWRHPSRTEEGSLSRAFVSDEPDENRTGGILFLDEPDHSRIRLPIAKAFYTRINKLKPEIEAIVNRVIDEAPDDGVFDLMNTIAIPVPILVIAHVLGVDEDRFREFREWSEAAILSVIPTRDAKMTEQMEWGQEKLDTYFTHLMAERRKAPKEDLISDMVQILDAGASLTETEVRINLEGLLIGGNLTTTDLIGNGVYHLTANPSELAKLLADPSLAGNAVEEILRFDPPVTNTTRVMPEDREIRGCPVHQSRSMWMSLQAANRDPEINEDPDTFNITRETIHHISFGGGTHICIGAPLARIEAKQVFTRLAQRYKSIELAEDEIIRRPLPFFRGIERLNVKVTS
ncbi:MAG: cytochrome P450 [Alphaproteobacteria bacterium]|nr:MAG: cytochrome P450 [Alphaproteobacteria bacterium]